MAAPETHIVLATEFLKIHPDRFEERDFIVATSFPDIRYLGVIDRDNTHFKDVTLEQVLSRGSFMAGVLFHNFVDEERTKYMKDRGLYDLLEPNPFVTQADKFYEDICLYPQIANWDKIRGYFDRFVGEELLFPVREEDITRWYSLLADYIKEKPSIPRIQVFTESLINGAEMANKLPAILENINQTPEAIKIINGFYGHFSGLIKRD